MNLNDNKKRKKGGKERALSHKPNRLALQEKKNNNAKAANIGDEAAVVKHPSRRDETTVAKYPPRTTSSTVAKHPLETTQQSIRKLGGWGPSRTLASSTSPTPTFH
jgi:hypothetical protein